MNHAALTHVLTLLITAVVLVSAFRYIRLPPILAYLVAGVFLGPSGFGLLPESADTRFLAEFGVVFLLFTVGLEFSLPQLAAMKTEVLGLGSVQVALTTALAAVGAWLMGAPAGAAFVIGGAIAMSSTALVIKQLTEQLELNSRHGRLSVGILLFQDLAVIPFLIIIPALPAETSSEGIALEIAKALAIGTITAVSMMAVGYWALRPLFRVIATARSAELFTLTVLLFSLAAAWLTNAFGLSLALGAFLAGMMLGETEYRHQVEADIRPFRDVFLGLFFITIGMLFDLSFAINNAAKIVGLVVAISVAKALIILVIARLFHTESGVALRTGVSLAQTGEFGFALLALALQDKVIDSATTQLVIPTLVLSMATSPFLIRYNGWLAKHIFANSYIGNRQQASNRIAAETSEVENHVIICGFGRVGQNVARFLAVEDIPYVALDLDPSRVAEAHKAGDRVYYGDSTQESILAAAGLMRARVVVVCIDEPHAAQKILPQIRNLRPDIPILVRTRDDGNLEKLLKAGATEVVPETLEASLMMVAHLLYLLDVPVAKILNQLQNVRAGRYQILREFFPGRESLGATPFDPTREGLHAVTLHDAAYAVGKTPAELNLEELDVVLSGIRRGEDRNVRPRPDFLLLAGDVLIVYGAPEALERAEAFLLQG